MQNLANYNPFFQKYKLFLVFLHAFMDLQNNSQKLSFKIKFYLAIYYF
jgi:hypothetical protein